jgi:hypothetical protein
MSLGGISYCNTSHVRSVDTACASTKHHVVGIERLKRDPWPPNGSKPASTAGPSVGRCVLDHHREQWLIGPLNKKIDAEFTIDDTDE